MRKATDQGGAKKRRAKGFAQAGSLLSTRVRKVGETRGFAETRLLTRWAEIAGPDLAAVARPVKVSYAREGMGATLVVLCEGARAPEVEMQAPQIRERVNACYGYNAISRVRITQTAPQGFAEAPAAYTPPAPQPEPVAVEQVKRDVAPVEDADLRAALQKLGENVLSRPKPTTDISKKGARSHD